MAPYRMERDLHQPHIWQKANIQVHKELMKLDLSEPNNTSEKWGAGLRKELSTGESLIIEEKKKRNVHLLPFCICAQEQIFDSRQPLPCWHPETLVLQDFWHPNHNNWVFYPRPNSWPNWDPWDPEDIGPLLLPTGDIPSFHSHLHPWAHPVPLPTPYTPRQRWTHSSSDTARFTDHVLQISSHTQR